MSKAEASVEETKVLLANAEKEVSRVKVAAQALPRKELEDRTDHVLRLQASLNAQLPSSSAEVSPAWSLPVNWRFAAGG